MLDRPLITTTRSQLTAFIPVQVRRDQARGIMGPSLHELRSVLQAQHRVPCGPWFSHLLNVDSDVLDLRLGVAVAAPVLPAGRVRTGELPAARVARAHYCGPYPGLAEAWYAFGVWIEVNGHVPANEWWECYVAGPACSPDPRVWCTQLNRPLIG